MRWFGTNTYVDEHGTYGDLTFLYALRREVVRNRTHTATEEEPYEMFLYALRREVVRNLTRSSSRRQRLFLYALRREVVRNNYRFDWFDLQYSGVSIRPSA